MDEYIFEQIDRLSTICLEQLGNAADVLGEESTLEERDAYRQGLLFANERIIAMWKDLLAHKRP